MRFLNIVFCVMVFAMPACAQETPKDNQVLPVDEATKDPDFFVFRRELIKAVMNRDVEAIKSVVSSDIRYSFGGEDGIDGFYKEVRLEDADTDFYDNLLNVLLNGGSFLEGGGNNFCAPYTFGSDKTIEPFEELITIFPDTPIYDKASADGVILERASYKIIKWRSDTEFSQDYVGVFTSDGKEGYVQRDTVRSPIFYRACFAKNADGQYKMNLFVAGD